MVASIKDFLFTNGAKALSSAAVAVMTFCIGLFWRRTLKPFIQSFFWQGRKLEDSYKGEFLQEGTKTVIYDHIEVKQNAGRVWGTMTAAAAKEGKYKFEATLSGDTLRGTFEGAGDHTTSCGAFLLITQAGSKDFKGWCIEPYEGPVIAYEYKWHSKYK